MFFFRHPKPVVDSRPVAEQSVQVKTASLPVLTELSERPSDAPTGDTDDDARLPAKLQGQ